MVMNVCGVNIAAHTTVFNLISFSVYIVYNLDIEIHIETKATRSNGQMPIIQ